MILGICRFCGSSDVRVDTTDYEACFGACRRCHATGPTRAGPDAAGRAWNSGLDGPVLAARELPIDHAPPIARLLRDNPRTFVDIMSLLAGEGDAYARTLAEDVVEDSARDRAAIRLVAAIAAATTPTAELVQEG